MALMVGALYDALRSVNVDAERARKASEEVADFQKQIADLKQDVTTVKGDVALLKWMTGFLLAANLAILVRLFA